MAHYRAPARSPAGTIRAVKLCLPRSRWPLWVFAAALLLKSAMPLLAGVSAQVQGKALGEVCTVYGVAQARLSADGHAPASDAPTDHGGAPCALTALATPAAFEPASPGVVVDAPAWRRLIARGPLSPTVADACAAWAAQLLHGPPARA
jgi:hypothetical protein